METINSYQILQNNNALITALISIGIILLVLLILASIYLISFLRRKTILMRKIDYLVEDLTYKSESLNVTVETINRISNYVSSLDAVTKKGFKSAINLLMENKNYIYSVVDKIRGDVKTNENQKRKNASKTKYSNSNAKKTSTTTSKKKPSVNKKTNPKSKAKK
jgi:Asp-tRNA(Asn)/Glu-tRNA(Gln) amidotransferase C subunit